MRPADHFQGDEAPRRALPRRGSGLNGQSPSFGEGGAPSARPDWEKNAASALDREKRRRDAELPAESLTIPSAVRNHLLRQAWAGGEVVKRSSAARRTLLFKWLVPAAAGLLAALAFLRDGPDRNVAAGATTGSTLRAPGGTREASSSGEVPGNLTLEESLLARLGISARKDAEVSFTKLAVVDRMLLEPRVILSSRFRMAIGLDLSAIEADGS